MQPRIRNVLTFRRRRGADQMRLGKGPPLPWGIRFNEVADGEFLAGSSHQRCTGDMRPRVRMSITLHRRLNSLLHRVDLITQSRTCEKGPGTRTLRQAFPTFGDRHNGLVTDRPQTTGVTS